MQNAGQHVHVVLDAVLELSKQEFVLADRLPQDGLGALALADLLIEFRKCPGERLEVRFVSLAEPQQHRPFRSASDDVAPALPLPSAGNVQVDRANEGLSRSPTPPEKQRESVPIAFMDREDRPTGQAFAQHRNAPCHPRWSTAPHW